MKQNYDQNTNILLPPRWEKLDFYAFMSNNY